MRVPTKGTSAARVFLFWWGAQVLNGETVDLAEELIARGWTDHGIAGLLDISTRTVRSIRSGEWREQERRRIEARRIRDNRNLYAEPDYAEIRREAREARDRTLAIQRAKRRLAAGMVPR